ncbi:sensor histidine kinase [Egicoccus halophilus]
MTEAHLATEARERALEERQQAVQRLEELDRWRRDFVSMIAHDLQTPIVGINGFLDLVLAGQIPDDELPDVHERLRSNARSMQELVDNLRAYTLLQEGRVEFRPQQLPLADFTAQLLADMAPVLREHTTRVDVPDDLRISIDRQALERILRNLLGNAARHTPPGTTVSIRAHRQGPTVIVEVHDDGPGIPDDLLERMFERFERGSSGGTGLGLAIARQLVELHDGAIEVISEPGAGAVFRLRLPDTDRSRDAHPEDSAR